MTSDRAPNMGPRGARTQRSAHAGMGVARPGKGAPSLGRGGAILALALTTAVGAGCAVGNADLERWESTQHGPEKIESVLRHDKYDRALRVEAALALVRMKPRSGRNVGIERLVRTLSAIEPETRAPIVEDLSKHLVEKLDQPPPKAAAEGPPPIDASFAYKDAAYALLTEPELVRDAAVRTQLERSLADWALADFENRIESRRQLFATDLLFEYLGPKSLEPLPKHITRDSRRIDKIAQLIESYADDATKAEAAKAIVELCKWILADEWLAEKTPEVKEANKAANLDPTEEQLKAQLVQYQDEELTRMFGALKRVGGRPAVDFALALASDDKVSEPRRRAALASIEKRIDPKQPKDVERLFALATSNAPPTVLDQAFRRLAELPRDTVAGGLTRIMSEGEKWLVRRAAGSTLMRMSTTKELPAILEKLPEKAFGLPEAITYGATITDVKGASELNLAGLRKLVDPLAASGSAAQRATALAFYLTHGHEGDVAALEKLEADRTRAPRCDEDTDCRWACVVPSSEDPKNKELKDVETLGDFVRYCVIPSAKARKASDLEKPDEPANRDGEKP